MAEKKNGKMSWGAGDVTITLPNGKKLEPKKKTTATKKTTTKKGGK